MVKKNNMILILFIFIFSTISYANGMTTLLDLKIEERASNVTLDEIWKTIPFKLPYAAKVKISIEATARDNGHADDDDIKWALNKEEFNWGTENAWDGRELMGKKKKVVIERSLLSGEHKIHIWADQRPTLHTVKIEMEIKEDIKGPNIKEATYIKNIGVRLLWDSVDKIKNYVVFRKETKEKNFKKLAEVSAPFYMDAFVDANKVYDYKIGIADSSGTVFGYSNEIKVELIEKTKVSVPKNIALNSSGTTVNITWDNSPEKELSKYIVYRKKAESITYDKIDETTKNSYTDSKVVENEKYYYAISAVDTSNNETDKSESNLIEIIFKGFKPEGTVSVFPEKLYPGQKAIVYFSPRRSKEIRKSRERGRRKDPNLSLNPEKIFFRYGWNGWDERYLVPESDSPEMTLDPESKYLVAEVEIPYYATQLDFVFFDELGNYDKNWAKDYHFAIEKDTIKPEPVPSIEITSKNKMLYIEWTAPRDPDVKNYDIYRSTSKDIGWTNPNNLVARGLTERVYRDTNVESNKTYYYRIIAWDYSGNQSDMSDVAEGIPTSVGVLLNDTCVWEPEHPSVGDMLKIYYVEDRGLLKAPKDLKIKVGVNNWDDSKIPIIHRPMLYDKVYGAWYYEYLIEDATNYINVAFSEGEKWDTNGGLNWNIRVFPDTTPPAKVKGIVGESLPNNQIRIKWDANKERDLAGYHVYKGKSRLNPTLLTATEFLDMLNIDEGILYEYNVTALDKSKNESEPSLIKVLSLKDVITLPDFTFTASLSARKPIRLIASTDALYNWKMEIMSNNGKIVKTYSGVSDAITVIWDLRNEEGEFITPGQYRYRVSVISEEGIMPKERDITIYQ